MTSSKSFVMGCCFLLMLCSGTALGADQRDVVIFDNCAVNNPGAHLSLEYDYFIVFHNTGQKSVQLNFPTPSPCSAEKDGHHPVSHFKIKRGDSKSCYLNKKVSLKAIDYFYSVSKRKSGKWTVCNDPIVVVSDGNSARGNHVGRESERLEKEGIKATISFDDKTCQPDLDPQVSKGSVLVWHTGTDEKITVHFDEPGSNKHSACLVNGVEQQEFTFDKTADFSCAANYVDDKHTIFPYSTSCSSGNSGSGTVYIGTPGAGKTQE